MRFFSPLSQDCRATAVRQSDDVRASVENLSPRTFGELTMQKFRDTRKNVERQSRGNLEKTCEHLTTIWLENKSKRHRTNVVRHSHECLATVVRMKIIGKTAMPCHVMLCFPPVLATH